MKLQISGGLLCCVLQCSGIVLYGDVNLKQSWLQELNLRVSAVRVSTLITRRAISVTYGIVRETLRSEV